MRVRVSPTLLLLTTTTNLNNAFTSLPRVTYENPNLSLTYSFKSGKQFMSTNYQELDKAEKSKDETGNSEDAFLSPYTISGSESNLFNNELDEDLSYMLTSDVYQAPLSPPQNTLTQALGTILTCSMLVTGNTIGAGIMAIPDVAGKPGMGVSSAIFIGEEMILNRMCSISTKYSLIGMYLLNLLSGIIIGEISIQQYEKTGAANDASSFKALAEGMLNNKVSGLGIAMISIIINWCVLAFALKRASALLLPLVSTSVSSDPNVIAGLIAASLIVIFFAQSEKTLSKVASSAGSTLLASFIVLITSGLMNMSGNPLASPGTESNLPVAVCAAAPIFLTVTIYQNIVPTVAKLVDFDRTKLNASLAIGSGIPLLMYLGYCFAALGGGIDFASTTSDNSVLGGLMDVVLNTFFVSAVTGSSIACIISLVEEFQSLVSGSVKNEDCVVSTEETCDVVNEMELNLSETLSEDSNIVNKLQSTVYAILPPFIAGAIFCSGNNVESFNKALAFAGAYFSPVLYGALPVFLAIKSDPDASKFPGGKIGLGLLGVSTTIFMGLQIAQDTGISLT